MTTITHEPAVSAGVPIDIIESLLREQLANPTARIVDYTSVPFPHQGTNDSTEFFRVSLSWALPQSPLDIHTATWIVKHWRAGGVRDSTLGITQLRDVLAWEQGWLRPTALPRGLVVPIIGARRSPDGREAWLIMSDVSAELSAYPRLGLSADQVLSRARAILARLARFHAMWEQPDRQAELQASPWLRRPEVYLWDLAPTYAQAMGRVAAAHVPPGASAPPAWDGLSADLEAFFDALAADLRSMWERLLVDRRALVEALARYPQTLLHNDLDDRNIGLRWPGRPEAAGAPDLDMPDLVLIDWEWMAIGPAVLDVARIVQFLPIVLAPGVVAPESFWNHDLAGYYFTCYRAAGGSHADAASWRRAYGQAILAQSTIQMPFTHGRMLRSIRGELPIPQIAGVADETVRLKLREGLPMMERMIELVMSESRRWLV